MKMYHNPRCSKSREVFAILESEKVKVEIIEYLKEPPSANELAQVCEALGCQPQEILRTKEKRFQELELSLSDDRSEAEWLQILADNPELLERPIVMKERRAVVGRPPEVVRELLERVDSQDRFAEMNSTEKERGE